MSVNEKYREGYEGHSNNIHHHLKCGYCSYEVSALEMYHYSDSQGKSTRWVICPLCSHGSVIDRSGKIYPLTKYGTKIESLPSDVHQLYDEVCDCMSVSAYTGAELVCRKIIMHIAIDKCKSKEGEEFAKYINDIEKAGHITSQMKDWVDEIRKIPNYATHSRSIPNDQEAKNVVNFTEQLLKLVYEIPGKAPKPSQQPSS